MKINKAINGLFYTGSENVKTLIKYGLLIIVFALSLFLYHHQLGSIPFLILSIYFTYEAYRECTKGNGRGQNPQMEEGKTP